MSQFKRVTLGALLTRYAKDVRPFDKDLLRAIEERDQNLASILDRGVDFDNNFDGRLNSFSSSGVANAENTVAHGLGKVPTGYIVTSIDKAAHVYKGASAWTKDNIYLKVDVATVAVSILVF